MTPRHHAKILISGWSTHLLDIALPPDLLYLQLSLRNEAESMLFFFLHILSMAAIVQDAEQPTWAINHLLLTVDTPKVQLTLVQVHSSICLLGPMGRPSSRFDCDILLNIACLYRAFTISRCIRVNSDFYNAFTFGLFDIACEAVGTCVKRQLALYIIDMRILVPDPTLNEAPLSFLRQYYSEPTTPDFSDGDPSPNHLPFTSPLSPSISAATEPADASVHDSGYKSTDTMPSLCTVEDSSDEYYSDSSKEPNSDEEEALIAQGFVIEESDTDNSDLDL
ncbi:hypothetical protein LXA43DRAFT_1064057 [Ganoderma leucocontextum]|nr:hypothetical protein LXA43DRAFT_1064057 [Ganoderma leucocontextum]